MQTIVIIIVTALIIGWTIGTILWVVLISLDYHKNEPKEPKKIEFEIWSAASNSLTK